MLRYIPCPRWHVNSLVKYVEEHAKFSLAWERSGQHMLTYIFCPRLLGGVLSPYGEMHFVSSLAIYVYG